MAGSHSLKRLRRWLSIGAALVGLVLVLMWMSGTFHAKVQPGRVEAARSAGPPTGRIVEVREIGDMQTASAVGAVRTRHKTEVASKLMATIEQIKVKAGQRVEANQLLATLDDSDLQAQLARAEAVVVAARADLNLQKGDYDRNKNLMERKAISPQEFERYKARFEVAQAELEQVRQTVNEIQANLKYTEIRAPVAGIVIDKTMEAGDMARPGHPILAIYDPKNLRLEANVRETLATGLSIGQELTVRIDAVGLEGKGSVEEIVPQADVASRSLLVKVALPSCACKHLYMGMFGRLLIPTGERRVFVAPAEAIQRIGQLEFAWVQRADGGRQRRFVKTGETIGADVEVLSGLARGEHVVVPAGPARTQPTPGAAGADG